MKKGCLAAMALCLLSGSAFGLPSYTATLSEDRAWSAATTIGNKAMFAGGKRASGNSNVVDIYDADTRQWSTAALSQARHRLVATTAGNQAIFAGGVISPAVDIYDDDTGQWSTAGLSQARAALAATSVGTTAMFAGGYRSGYVSSSVIDIYDADSGQWSTNSLSQPRWAPAGTTVGSKVLFAGGQVSTYGFSAVVDIYDAETGQWSTAALSQARAWLAATTVGNKALFAGGGSYYDGDYHRSNVVDIYDADTGQWSTATLSQARGFLHLSAATIGPYAIFAGGRVSGSKNMGVTSDVVDIYNADTGQWSTAALSLTRYGISATTVGGMALFAGGYSGDGTAPVQSTDAVDVFVIPEPLTMLGVFLSSLGLAGYVRKRTGRATFPA